MQRLITMTVALAILGQSSAMAALPDVETFNFVMNKYSLLMRQTRDGCEFYTDPEFIVARQERPNQPDKNIRQLIVVQTMGKNSGTACSGVFQFLYADVNCKTNQITYTNGVGSPATWKTDRYSDPEITKKICALPTVEFGTPTQNLPPAK